MSEIINNAIVHYRDDLDLQNLIDFGQKEVWAKRRGWAASGLSKSASPREASACRPVGFFITCQSNGFWEGGWKKKYMQGALKVFLRA